MKKMPVELLQVVLFKYKKSSYRKFEGLLINTFDLNLSIFGMEIVINVMIHEFK